MFTLLSKLAEILSSYGSRFLDGRHASRDSLVAAELLRIVLVLQELCATGEQALKMADGFVTATARPEDTAEFEQLLQRQVGTLDELGAAVETSRGLLATIDIGFYFELAPFLDAKSGLLARWGQQVAQSQFSTTTLFFLPTDILEQVIDVGLTHSSGVGLDDERTEFVRAVADNLRQIRRREVRDIRHAGEQHRARLKEEIDDARASLTRARELCTQLLASTEEAVGAEAMAGLRRSMVRRNQRV